MLENGTIADSSLSYYYPSIAVNASGDIVIGFSGSSTSTYASEYAVTGTFNGTTTTLGSPQLIKAGTGPYFIFRRVDATAGATTATSSSTRTTITPSGPSRNGPVPSAP